MFRNSFSWQRRAPSGLARRLTPFLLAGFALLVASASASADAQCRRVRGFYEEHADPNNCMSPVGLCIAGEYSGNIKGMFSATATSLTPSADTPATGVLFFTGDGVIHAQVAEKQGDLTFKSAGAFQSTGAGNIVDLQTITGGTGDLAGASGVIRASGVFDPATGMGESEYEGMICLP
jgi:hypothetical protein